MGRGLLVRGSCCSWAVLSWAGPTKGTGASPQVAALFTKGHQELLGTWALTSPTPGEVGWGGEGGGCEGGIIYPLSHVSAGGTRYP